MQQARAEQAELEENDMQSPLADDGEPIEIMADEAEAAIDPVAELQEQVAVLKDQLLRAVAETENVRRRAQRDLEENGKYAITGFARQLISVAENLQRATSSIPDEMRAGNEAVKSLAEGVEMTHRELLSVFERAGIRRIEPMGEKFDHNFHQAMVQIPSNEAEPNTVLQVLQAGYVIHERLLQPALVGVAVQGEANHQLDTQV